MIRNCHACQELAVTLKFNGHYYCKECHDELRDGIIPAAHGPLEEESPFDLWLDDNLEARGRWENAVKAYEEDMPDATQYGYRDADLPGFHH
jgi:hypothetical protein